MAKPVAFHDLPAEAFPLTMRAYRIDNDRLVWEQTLDGPGAVEIPPLKQQEGVEIYVAISYADGSES